MSYGTSLYDKFLYSSKLQWPRGVSGWCLKILKNFFLTFLGLGTNVVKVISVNSELLFQLDTLMHKVFLKVFCDGPF